MGALRIMVWPASDDNDGTAQYRLLQPARVLAAEGHDVVVDRNGPNILWSDRWEGQFPPGTVDVIGLASRPEADAVVLQRPGRKFWAQMIPHLQAAGIRVIVDVDDNFDAIHQKHIGWAHYQPQFHPWHNKDWIKEACRLADLVTCSTPALQKVYGHGHGRVIPNFVPESYLSIGATPLPLVGWSGHVGTHPGDLEVTKGAIQRALDTSEWGFHVIGTGQGVRAALGLKEEPTNSAGWVRFVRYPYRLAEIGIGIVPLEDSAFNHAKSAIKMMEFSALGIPCVASPIPDNVRVNKLGVGQLATSPQRWFKTIRALIGSSDYRADLAARSQEAMRDLTYERNAHLWLTAWEGKRVGALA